MKKLDDMLRQVNPFADYFTKMHQIVQSNLTVPVKMVFIEDGNLDLRRYNKPTTTTEVAAIFVGDDGEPPANRDIIIYPTGSSCKNISPINQCADPMVYPLLFPSGEFGWNSSLEHVEERQTSRRTRVTQLQFYAYRLAVRDGFSVLHASGKLFHQYIVDVYVKTEGSRLNYLRQNQKNLRVELYQGLLDALQSQARNEQK
ncbi:uncharacterized protein [Parasteatoda tepidariorum]|uniref:uncharacterized protein n=1 Tax=Parasteatoda tepidariorum TaxID=114398 RepID=UPI0039BCF263